MSRVMKALELSEQNYQAASFSPVYQTMQVSQPKKKANKWLAAGLLVVPPLLVGVISSYDLLHNKLIGWKDSTHQSELAAHASLGYQEAPYPVFGRLQATYELVAPIYEQPIPTAAPETVKPKPVKKQPPPTPTPTAKDPLLGELDLSQLSPELAMHVQSVLGKTPPPPAPEPKVQASNLSTHGERWYGKLPAMNFETHVFSSNPAKRWVKINGNEFKEGDWVTNNVKLDKIAQHSCLLSFNGEKIEVPALYDWKG